MELSFPGTKVLGYESSSYQMDVWTDKPTMASSRFSLYILYETTKFDNYNHKTEQHDRINKQQTVILLPAVPSSNTWKWKQVPSVAHVYVHGQFLPPESV